MKPSKLTALLRVREEIEAMTDEGLATALERCVFRRHFIKERSAEEEIIDEVLVRLRKPKANL